MDANSLTNEKKVRHNLKQAPVNSFNLLSGACFLILWGKS